MTRQPALARCQRQDRWEDVVSRLGPVRYRRALASDARAIAALHADSWQRVKRHRWGIRRGMFVTPSSEEFLARMSRTRVRFRPMGTRGRKGRHTPGETP